MAESTLTSTYADIQQIAGLEMGWGRNPSLWTTTNETDFGIACKEGYRQFLYPVALPGENKSHNWSFLYPMGQLMLTAGRTTGTITVAASVTLASISSYTVTGSSTVFPTWVPGNYITYTASSVAYSAKILDYFTPSLLTLGEDGGTAAAGTTYSIPHRIYDLPDDFGGMASDSFTYRRDEQWHLPQIKIVGEAEIRKVDRANDGEVYPRWASIVPVSPTVLSLQSDGSTIGTSKSTRWQAFFYPVPEQTYYLEYRYHAIPPALDATTNIYHYGGAEHSQTIMASVIDALYRRVRSSNEKQEEFQNRLRQSILHDRRNYNTGNLGQKLNYTDGKDALRDFRASTPTGNITTTFY